MALHFNAQERTFLNSGKTHKIEYKYYVNEIVLKSDSTFTQRYYEFKNRKGINNYKKSKPKLKSNGTFIREGKNYLFNKLGPNDFVHDYFKLSENRLIFLYHRNGKWKRGARFKLASD